MDITFDSNSPQFRTLAEELEHALDRYKHFHDVFSLRAVVVASNHMSMAWNASNEPHDEHHHEYQIKEQNNDPLPF